MKATHRRISARIAVAVAAVSLAAAQYACAQTTWTGAAGDNLWATAGNWTAGVPLITTDTIFNGSTALNVVLPVSGVARGVTFDNSAGFTSTGNASGNGLSLSNGGITVTATSGPVTIAGSTNLNGTSQSYINNSVSTLTIGNNVAQAGNPNTINFTVDGSGPIVITGGLTNSGGTPTVATTNLIKNGSGSLQLGNGSMKGSVTLNAGTILSRGSNMFGTTAKTLTINGGTITALVSDRLIPAAISVAVGGDCTLNGASSTSRLSFAGPVGLGGTTRQITVDSSQGTEFQGVVSAGGITVAGSGALTLTNASNTYTGATTVNSAAALIVTSTSSVPAGSSLTVNSGAFYGGRLGSDSSLTTTDLDAIKDNTTIFNAAGKNFAIEVTATGAPDTTPLTYSSVISDLNGDSRGFGKYGAGTLALGSDNTYSGNTYIEAGILNIDAESRLGAASNIVVFNPTGSNTSELRYTTAVGTINKKLNFASGSGILDIGTNNTTLAGTISGSGTMRKYGSATLELTADNSAFTGTIQIGNGTTSDTSTIDGGALLITNPNQLGDTTGGTTVSGNANTVNHSVLQLSGGFTTAEPITIQGKSATDNPTPSLESVSGTNTVSVPISMSAGATWYTVQSDAGGKLNMAGFTSNGGNSTGRTIRLIGDGDGEVTGTIQNGTSTGNLNLWKNGNGTWTISGTANLYGATATTNTIQVDAGTLIVKNSVSTGNPSTAVRGATAVNAGTLRLAHSSDNNTVLTTGTLLLADKLDITNNKIITSDSVANIITFVKNAMAIDGTTGLPQWTGAGITTSEPAAFNSHAKMIGVASAADAKGLSGSQTILWGGQTVTSTDTLAMYTWGGDADLNGKLNADDYFLIDSNFSKSPDLGGSSTGWNKGDFNYDGLINGDDLMILDSNFSAAQGNPIGASSPLGGGVTAVPEPASLLGLGVIAATSFLRRARRR